MLDSKLFLAKFRIDHDKNIEKFLEIKTLVSRVFLTGEMGGDPPPTQNLSPPPPPGKIFPLPH